MHREVRPDQINLLLLGFSDQKIGSSNRKKEKLGGSG